MGNVPSVSFEFFPPRTEEGIVKLKKTVKIYPGFHQNFSQLHLALVDRRKKKHQIQFWI